MLFFLQDAIPIAYNRLPRCAEVLQKLQVEPDHTLLIRVCPLHRFNDFFYISHEVDQVLGSKISNVGF